MNDFDTLRPTSTSKSPRQLGADNERRRIIGMVLAEYGRQKLAGNLHVADVLDALATTIEHGDNQEARTRE